jgi:hypothetical protein
MSSRGSRKCGESVHLDVVVAAVDESQVCGPGNWANTRADSALIQATDK